MITDTACDLRQANRASKDIKTMAVASGLSSSYLLSLEHPNQLLLNISQVPAAVRAMLELRA